MNVHAQVGSAGAPATIAYSVARDPAARRAIFIATCVVWTANFLFWTIERGLDGAELQPLRFLARLTVCLLGAGECYLIHLVLDRLGGRPFVQQALAAALLAPLAGEIFLWINGGARWLIGSTVEISAGETFRDLASFLWFYLAWITTYLAISYGGRLKAQERHWSQLEALAHASQLKALRYQINPHFLFNTLNSVSSLIIDGKSKEADVMTNRLANFYRTSLTLDPLDSITLEEEFALQKTYLAIEQVRFPDLAVDIDCPPALQRALIPSLLLQPIIENSVKYAVAASPHPATIRISARKDGDQLRLEVRDDGRPLGATPGTGTGLANVRRRLVECYGERADLEAGPVSPHGFSVVLRLPLEME